MTPGEPSPWGPRSPDLAPAAPYAPEPHPAEPYSPDPYAASYAGPWSAPGAGHVSDDQLRRLPPPAPVAGPGRPASPVVPGVQRPAVLGLAVTMAVTAALLWMCGLSLFLLVAVAGTQRVSPFGDEGYVFHTLDEVLLRMGDGLWVPLYGFPVASLVTGFLLLAGRPWTRVAHTVVGVAALGWASWWLRHSLLAWFVVAVYVATAVAVLWFPAVGRWYAARPQRSRTRPTTLSG